MQFPDFNPVLLALGPISIRWYALAYIAGILLGWRYALTLAANSHLWGSASPPLARDQIDDLVLWMTIGIIIGGRLGYIVFYEPQVIWSQPLEILRIWRGGMSFHGGLIGVTLALIAFSRRAQVDPLRLGDMVAPCVPIGLFFGRLANFINGELWGRVTHVPWAIVFCNARLLAENGGVCPAGWSPRHPSQLYEAAVEGVLLFFVLRWATHWRRCLRRRGSVTGLFLLVYGLGRMGMETVRNPDLAMPQFPFDLTMGMILSIPLVVVGVWLLWAARKSDGGLMR